MNLKIIIGYELILIGIAIAYLMVHYGASGPLGYVAIALMIVGFYMMIYYKDKKVVKHESRNTDS